MIRKIIIEPDGDLKREVWEYSLDIDGGYFVIRLDHYAFQTRLSTRHRKWKSENEWDRLINRDNTMKDPPYSSFTFTKAKEYFIHKLKATELQPIEVWRIR